MAAKAKARRDWWPSRTGEPGRCFSSDCVGPSPADGLWSWRPGGCYDTPLLDGDGHIFTTDRTRGISMWNLDMCSKASGGDGKGVFPLEGIVGTLALANGVLYAVTEQGYAAAIVVKDGKHVWKTKYCAQVGQDPISVGVGGDVVTVVGASEAIPAGSVAQPMSDMVYGLAVKDGKKLWQYKPGMIMLGQNFTPAIIDDLLVFMNSKADVCCVKLKDGSQQWKTVPKEKGISRSFAGVIVSKNRMVYSAMNRPGKKAWNAPCGGKGGARAFNLKDGSVKWEVDFDLEANTLPSLVSTGPGGKQVLVYSLGATPGFKEGNKMGQAPLGDTWHARIVGLDPETGAELWTSGDAMVMGGQSGREVPWDQRPEMQINAITSCVGGGDGTFYFVWQGLVCQNEAATGKSVGSFFDFNALVQANPVLGPGILVIASPYKMIGVMRAVPPKQGKVVRPLDVSLEVTGEDHFWPCKQGPDLMNPGFTAGCKAPNSLTKPNSFWQYANLYAISPRWPDDNLYNSPAVDSQRNLYIAANFSDLYVIRPDGRLRGSVYVGPLVSTPVLIGKACYIVDGCGFAHSIDIETLKHNWRTKYCVSNPWDSWSAGGKGDAIIVGGNADFRTNGATHLYRLSTEDGRTVWAFPYPRALETGAAPYNMIPAITDDGKVVTANNRGIVYCNDLETGELLWSVTPESEEWAAQFTTATVTCGRNGLAANAWNKAADPEWNLIQGKLGKLDVYEIASGNVKWEKNYNLMSVNVAPLWLPPDVTVGSSGWQVVVCLGSNPGPPEDHAEPVNGDAWTGLMVAHDGDSGVEVWSWAPPITRHFTFRGSDKDDWYLPDAWTSVSSDSSGTIYGSFQDGVMYAVKGGELISKFDMRSCCNCAPGIAPGMVATMNQFGLLIWRDAELEEEWAKSGDKRAAGGKLPGGAAPTTMACGGPWDDGRLEWSKPRPWEEPRGKTTADDVADRESWLAEHHKCQEAALAEDLEWSEAKRAEKAAAIKAAGGGAAAAERPAAKEGSTWVVVGGGDKGGIVVRNGEGLKTPELGRLATGSTMEETELKGDRLHFKKLTGDGPDFGWVSLSFKGSPLVRREG